MDRLILLLSVIFQCVLALHFPSITSAFLIQIPLSYTQRIPNVKNNRHNRDILVAAHNLHQNELPPPPELLQTPHAGCHFPSSHPLQQQRSQKIRQSKNKRYFEGWYYRLTLPSQNASFAFILSIEDAGHSPSSPLSLAACQIMGPDDDYLVRSDRDDSKFWALKETQTLGCVFDLAASDNNDNDNDDDSNNHDKSSSLVIPPHEYFSTVTEGFQCLPSRLQGRIFGHDGHTDLSPSSKGNTPGTCTWDVSITNTLAGYGDSTSTSSSSQRSTAGWLSSLPVFEPHWQITMADARASGYVDWNGTRYDFDNAMLYAEKNWGGTFPTKWQWVQCNAFRGYDDNGLSVTGVGAVRALPLLGWGGRTEDVGLVVVHYGGVFYEIVPWTGTMKWDVDTWGYWAMTGRCTKGERKVEVELRAICDSPGVKLRAPTKDEGLVYFCRDSFYASVELSMWEIHWDNSMKEYVRGDVIIEQAQSNLCAVEVGGGPWWSRWTAVSNMKQPMRALVRLPYLARGVKRRIFGKS